MAGESMYRSKYKTFDDIVILPQGLPGLVSPGIRVELSDDDALGRGLKSQRHDYSLSVIPALDNLLFVDLPNRLNHPVILIGMFENRRGRWRLYRRCPGNEEQIGSRTDEVGRNSLRSCRGYRWNAGRVELVKSC